MSAEVPRDYRTAFEEVYESPSAIEDRLTREVLGDDCPEALASYSFPTRSDIRRLADALRVGPGSTLVDLGCGRGAGGLGVAGQLDRDRQMSRHCFLIAEAV